eukprot:scaffold2098_cov21-Tisochrysis_lutea.AAC.1
MPCLGTRSSCTLPGLQEIVMKQMQLVGQMEQADLKASFAKERCRASTLFLSPKVNKGAHVGMSRSA